ncbi:probable E3 ubiquitin-protein ligase HIP1 isoform X1 [Musa acuminata AAA Group]|uniref:probable E3 ubiquitin-protein ligase HIP1 isoform X1 n=1 Tax=Musa acuminata AAA Group TaxID=214697 RepID=UPI0031E0F179
MQGQRSSFQPFCEAFEYDRASGSSSSVMDQQMFWNNLLFNSVENHDLPSNPLSPSGTNISRGNVVCQGSASLNIWDPVGTSSSMPSLDQGSNDEIKQECGWTFSLSNRDSGPRISDDRSEGSHTLSFQNTDAELNGNHANNGEPFSQFLNFRELPHNLDYGSAHVGMSSQVLESGQHQEPYNPGLMQYQPVSFSGSSSGTFESSSRAIDFLSNNDRNRQRVALDDQSFSHKRKNIERFHGESSASGSSSNFNEGVKHAEEEINAGIGTSTRVAASEHQYFGSAAVNDESFQRNIRTRVNHADLTNATIPNLLHQENYITQYNLWPAQQPSLTIPSNQPSNSRLVGSHMGPRRQPLVQTIPGLSPDLYPFPQSGTSTREANSSSSSPAISVDGASRELNSMSVSSNLVEQLFIPPPNTRQLVQNQTNRGLTIGNTTLSGNGVPTSQVGTNSGVYQSPGANWVPHHQHRRLSETILGSFLSSVSESRGWNMSLPPHNGHSSTSQEVGRHQPGAGPRNHQQLYMRFPNMLHRQNDGALSNPLSMRTLAAARERRSRTSEIRNVFDLIRRGDTLLLEDFLSFEQSGYVGGTNFHDRYRDMRLDVDNMSYEELLVLGERIGNVNTGLSEEKILNCLRQRKYVSIASEPSGEVEPCCICREEYMEGAELGRLDCGHDFHTACIKQWLMIKNLCPVCKTTALST